MSVHIPFAPGKQGVFLERLNRFVALVCVDGAGAAPSAAFGGLGAGRQQVRSYFCDSAA